MDTELTIKSAQAICCAVNKLLLLKHHTSLSHLFSGVSVMLIPAQ
jgi:hypothetical protein